MLGGAGTAHVQIILGLALGKADALVARLEEIFLQPRGEGYDSPISR